MKKALTIILVSLLTVIAIPSFAQLITPPGDGAGGTGGHLPNGGSAPIGSGLLSLIILASTYTGFKMKYSSLSEKVEE